MRFQHRATYRSPATEVYAMVIDPEFREAVGRRQGSLSHEVRVSAAAEGVEVAIDQVLPARGIPPLAAKFVGSEIQVRRTEHWTSPTQATVDISIPGKPGQLVGTLVLTESGEHTTGVLDSELTVSIPLLGGKLEALIADLFTTALDTEAEVATSFLGPAANPS
ncbi:MAG: DUF2505 domain-containing protein [Nocardioides sp.]